MCLSASVCGLISLPCRLSMCLLFTTHESVQPRLGEGRAQLQDTQHGAKAEWRDRAYSKNPLESQHPLKVLGGGGI